MLLEDVSLVIGDAHTDPSQLKHDGLRRFKWLNHLILNRPEIKRLIIMGDFLSMTSLSHWDRNKRRKIEGKRYVQDIEAGNVALNLLLDRLPIDIERVYVMGNHEDWFEQYLDMDPTFEGLHDLIVDLDLSVRGFRVVPYKEDYKHKGVSFTHIPIQTNGKPIGGKNATSKALELYSNSVVFGHTHNFDVAGLHRKNSASYQQAINCGCFFEHIDDYAKGSATNYWRGVLLLNHYDHNRVDISEQWSMGRLRKYYESSTRTTTS